MLKRKRDSAGVPYLEDEGGTRLTVIPAMATHPGRIELIDADRWVVDAERDEQAQNSFPLIGATGDDLVWLGEAMRGD